MNWDDFINDNVGPMTPYAPGLRGSQVAERLGVAEVSKLSSNENPYGPFPRALEAGHQILQHLNRYPDGSSRDLRGRLSEKLDVPVENVVVGNGSNELLVLLGQTCLKPGDEVVYGWPSFIVYPMVCQLMGATPVAVPLTQDHRFDLQAMAAAITPATKIVFICNPNNPTGTIVRKDEFEAFLEQVPAHVLVVIDEAYIEYCVDPAFPDGLQYFDGKRPIVVLRTFSKVYSLAGARCGYGVVPRPLAEALDKVREPFNVSTVAQAMAYYSLDDEVELHRRTSENEAHRDTLCACFDRLGIVYAQSHTNFIWTLVPRTGELFDFLLSRGIIVRDFGNAHALRVGIGNTRDTEQTVAAFEAAYEQGMLA